MSDLTLTPVELLEACELELTRCIDRLHLAFTSLPRGDARNEDRRVELATAASVIGHAADRCADARERFQRDALEQLRAEGAKATAAELLLINSQIEQAENDDGGELAPELAAFDASAYERPTVACTCQTRKVFRGVFGEAWVAHATDCPAAPRFVAMDGGR